jgi:DNA-binding FrmR family transcriptional regulator
MRSDEEKKALLTRLKKAEGQIRGIEKMIEEDAYCPDILTQVAAVTAALNSFNKELLACHMRSCVIEDIKSGKEETIDEFVKLMQKLMK